ncbi:hypothetical protein [Chachezhania antarctica]|uniref:hypothetical protein n=1 Tax=Chachezhania antarctica TaxID=2340860 RepID=UPI0013CF101E|nr:hypothetical protein [Chachezhania antarctica]|tara:strand:+ start:1114 stop:1287 length:174 start_codon:yes stop_codon:yes gene_type:complete
MAQVFGALLKYAFGLAVVLCIIGAVGVVIYAAVGPFVGVDFSAPVEPQTAAITLQVD